MKSANDLLEAKRAKDRKSPWEIVFGLSGLLAVFATVVVALITYNQNLKIQSLQSTAGQESDRVKGQVALAVQESASKTSLTEAQLKTELDKQLGKLTNDRELSLTARDLEMKKYVNDENTRLGRFSKQSDVDLKLVDIATAILTSASTESNQELRRWAVNIVNSHSNVVMNKEATAEAVAGPISGEPVEVSVLSHYRDGKATNGCRVMYMRPGSNIAFRFPMLSVGGYSDTFLSKGAYTFWVECKEAPSDKQQFYAQKSPLKIEFEIQSSGPPGSF